jgi:hypothetical protein
VKITAKEHESTLSKIEGKHTTVRSLEKETECSFTKAIASLYKTYN